MSCSTQLSLLSGLGSRGLLLEGDERAAAIASLREHHYTHSVSSGKTHYFKYEDALLSFSIPANKNIGAFLLGRACKVWELTRMWAPDGHERNLLTRAISACVQELRKLEPEIEALVSYADPNVMHTGGVYRAASWVDTGRSEESRYYIGPDGQIAARRKFHSGQAILRKKDIEALGYVEAKLPGKFRFVHGLTRRARKDIEAKWGKVRSDTIAGTPKCPTINR